MTECRYPNCDRDARGGGGHSGRFCSDEHEVKYDHLKADAADAQRAEQQHHDDAPRHDRGGQRL
jgi:hypothetical protein